MRLWPARTALGARARHAEGPCDSHRLRRGTHTAGRQRPALPAPRRIQQ
ncbi:putative transporter [Pseudomonas aeruginosa 39016]|nr:putative transporter [Pseudomonas aeruginosa 39016]